MIFLHKVVLCVMSFVFCAPLVASEIDLERQQEMSVPVRHNFMYHAKAASLMGLTSGVASVLSFNNYLMEFEDGQNPMASHWFRSSVLFVTFSGSCVGVSAYFLSRAYLERARRG